MELPANLTEYRPAKTRSGRPLSAVIVCPGGGYAVHAEHEGVPIALWLNSLGIAAYILNYRLTAANPHPAPLDDALGAIRFLKGNAAALGLEPDKVGILGFSAGGHLTASAAVHGAKAADPLCRPDLAVLVYPVISMQLGVTHLGSRENLLGKNPSPELVELMSCEKQVTTATPPCFLFHTADDEAVPVQNSLAMAAALAENRVPFELLVLQTGHHGVGLATGDPVLSQWTGVCAKWLTGQSFGG